MSYFLNNNKRNSEKHEKEQQREKHAFKQNDVEQGACKIPT